MSDTQRYALLGTVGAGKTTLFNALRGEYGIARKTQAVEFDEIGGVDTPGEFFSHPRLYNALISSTSDVDILIYVHAADDMECRLPAGLLAVYGNKRIITVISKIDLPESNVPKVREMLQRHGVDEPILAINSHDPDSVQSLVTLLRQYGKEVRITA